MDYTLRLTLFGYEDLINQNGFNMETENGYTIRKGKDFIIHIIDKVVVSNNSVTDIIIQQEKSFDKLENYCKHKYIELNKVFIRGGDFTLNPSVIIDFMLQNSDMVLLFRGEENKSQMDSIKKIANTLDKKVIVLDGK